MLKVVTNQLSPCVYLSAGMVLPLGQLWYWDNEKTLFLPVMSYHLFSAPCAELKANFSTCTTPKELHGAIRRGIPRLSQETV